MSAAARRMQDDTVGWLLGVIVGPTACESLQLDGAFVAVIASSGEKPHNGQHSATELLLKDV